MDIHKNARLSFRSREALAGFVLVQGATRKAAAAAFRVSAKTVAKWVGRFQRAGLDGLVDRSSRPQRSPRRLPESVAGRVVELRRGHMPGFAELRMDIALFGLQIHDGCLDLDPLRHRAHL